MSTTSTATKPARTTRAQRAAAVTATKTATIKPAGTKPAPAKPAGAKPAPVTTVVGGSGISATGDNGHGFKKIAAAKPAPAAGAASGAASGAAAQPVKLTAAKTETGPTKTSMNREIAKAMVTALGELAAGWDAEKTGIPAEMVQQSLASWANYAPVPADFWDARLAPRSGAGGRGAKNRQAA